MNLGGFGWVKITTTIMSICMSFKITKAMFCFSKIKIFEEHVQFFQWMNRAKYRETDLDVHVYNDWLDQRVTLLIGSC